jgi:aminoglycoside phosphotransferase (APT) family kinase protein
LTRSEHINDMSSDALARELISHSRRARSAADPGEWTDRLKRLIESRPTVDGTVVVDSVRPVESNAGGSNGTLLFRASYCVAGKPTGGDFVLRFAPERGLFKDFDLRAQTGIQRALQGTDVPVPEIMWEDESGAFLGVPGYVMRKVDGSSPAMAWQTSGLIADATPEERGAMFRSYVRTLAAVHAVPVAGCGLEFLKERGSDRGVLGREIAWYWSLLEWGGTKRDCAELSGARRWLHDHQPTIAVPCLCHGDSNLGNYLFRGTRITAVLDWELAFLGTPQCDIGFFWHGAAALQPDVPMPQGVPSFGDLVSDYESVSGNHLGDWDYYDSFAMYRINIIQALAVRHLPPAIRAQYGGLADAVRARLMASID